MRISDWLNPDVELFGVDNPKVVWNKVDSLGTSSVFFERIEGPFERHEIEDIFEDKLQLIRKQLQRERIQQDIKEICQFYYSLFVPQGRQKDYYDV